LTRVDSTCKDNRTTRVRAEAGLYEAYGSG
jgi:hypothetical protein